MHFFIILIFTCVHFACNAVANVAIVKTVLPSVKFRIMTLNAYHGGNFVKNGVQKISKHILINNPHVVALQEMNMVKITELLQFLGPKWKHCNSTYFFLGRYLDTCIITRLPIEENYDPVSGFFNTGCRVGLKNRDKMIFINVWNVHLFNLRYGPYQVCFQNQTSEERLNVTEYKYRMKFIEKLLNHTPFQQNLQNTNTSPLFLVGDFNSPSHLDWISSTQIKHCNSTIYWPVTALIEGNDFIDSFRKYVSDPFKYPGNTWSPIIKFNEDEEEKIKPEPQDRIDYIFYKSENLRLISSKVYFGNESISTHPNQYLNDWPSDHAAVISTFSCT